MAKRFKIRFPSFQFCRFKDPSTFPGNPTPAKYCPSPTNPKALHIGCPSVPDPPPSTPETPSKIVSACRICRTRTCKRCVSSLFNQITESPDKTPRRQSNSQSNPVHRFSDYEEAKLRFRTGNRLYSNLIMSEQYRDQDEDENDDDSLTLLSFSRSFSDDFSYEFVNNNSLETIRNRSEENEIYSVWHKIRKKKINKMHINEIPGVKSLPDSNIRKGSRLEKASRTAEMVFGKYSPMKGLSFRRMMSTCSREGKVRESFAVVKKSKNPYEDFKRSMLEMIMEKELFEAEELEELLQCFLSLNSRHYHEVIVRAFMEIWDAIFHEQE